MGEFFIETKNSLKENLVVSIEELLFLFNHMHVLAYKRFGMRRVVVKSVFDAFDYVMQHYYPAGLEELIEKSDTYAVISIQDSHTCGFGVTFSENQYCKGVLTLLFDDIDHEVNSAVLFSDEMAKQIIQFIKEHKAVDTLLVHCYAGQSRSQAVGAFAVKMLGGNNSAYFKHYNPNMYVYQVLETNLEKDCQ